MRLVKTTWLLKIRHDSLSFGFSAVKGKLAQASNFSLCRSKSDKIKNSLIQKKKQREKLSCDLVRVGVTFFLFGNVVYEPRVIWFNSPTSKHNCVVIFSSYTDLVQRYLGAKPRRIPDAQHVRCDVIRCRCEMHERTDCVFFYKYGIEFSIFVWIDVGFSNRFCNAQHRNFALTYRCTHLCVLRIMKM